MTAGTLHLKNPEKGSQKLDEARLQESVTDEEETGARDLSVVGHVSPCEMKTNISSNPHEQILQR